VTVVIGDCTAEDFDIGADRSAIHVKIVIDDVQGFMKRLLFFAVFLIVGLNCVMPVHAEGGTKRASQARAARKADSKQRKAVKKYQKAQRKAQRKMIKKDRKNTHLPSHY
jgi:hypothetical protein